MTKYIYEFKKAGYDSKEACKNKYTVVYENKSFYYCKVNGRDTLETFIKHRENVRNYEGDFWSTNDFDVDEAVKHFNLEKQTKDLSAIESSIMYKQRELDQLIKTKELLEILNK